MGSLGVHLNNRPDRYRGANNAVVVYGYNGEGVDESIFRHETMASNYHADSF